MIFTLIKHYHDSHTKNQHFFIFAHWVFYRTGGKNLHLSMMMVWPLEINSRWTSSNEASMWWWWWCHWCFGYKEIRRLFLGRNTKTRKEFEWKTNYQSWKFLNIFRLLLLSTAHPFKIYSTNMLETWSQRRSKTIFYRERKKLETHIWLLWILYIYIDDTSFWVFFCHAHTETKVEAALIETKW